MKLKLLATAALLAAPHVYAGALDGGTVTGGTTGAVAVGPGAVADANDSVVIGNGAQATFGTASTGDGAVVIGSGAFADANGGVAIGAGADAGGVTNSVALGAGSVATQANTVAIGGRRLTGLAAGRLADDAVNLGQLWSLRDELRKGIAAVAATPEVPHLAAGERTVAAGMASYGGFAAVGVTYAEAYNNSAQFYVGANFSNDSTNPVFRAGGAWKW